MSENKQPAFHVTISGCEYACYVEVQREQRRWSWWVVRMHDGTLIRDGYVSGERPEVEIRVFGVCVDAAMYYDYDRLGEPAAVEG